MQKQTTQRLKRSGAERNKAKDKSSKGLGTVMLELAKAGLRGLMMNPTVLHWLLVRVPAFFSDIEELFKE